MHSVLAASQKILAPEHIAIIAVLLVGLAIYGLVRRKKKEPWP